MTVHCQPMEGIPLSDNPHGGPRPPDGDWLGTPFLTFTRDGAFAICTLDRPQARNAMMFTGRTLTAQEAIEWGMVARVVLPPTWVHPELQVEGRL